MAVNQRPGRTTQTATERVNQLPSSGQEQVRIVLRLPDLQPPEPAPTIGSTLPLSQPAGGLRSQSVFSSATIDSMSVDTAAYDLGPVVTPLRSPVVTSIPEGQHLKWNAAHRTAAPHVQVNPTVTDAVFEKTATTDQHLAMEVAHHAAQVVRSALPPTRLARLVAAFGGFSALLVRPEVKLVLAIAALFRAISKSRAAETSTSGTVALRRADQALMPRLFQTLAQPNALLAAVLALACVLLLVLMHGSTQPAKAPAPAQMAQKQAPTSSDWNSPLTAAVVEPNKADAPPFPTPKANGEVPAMAQPAAPGSDAAPPVTPHSLAPPQPAAIANAPAPPLNNPMRASAAINPRRLPSAGANAPLSLATAGEGVAPTAPAQAVPAPAAAHAVQGFPPRTTDESGMPVVIPAAPKQPYVPTPPRVEEPPGGFNAIGGPQVIYPAQAPAHSPVAAKEPIQVARRLPPITQTLPATGGQGAKLRGIIRTTEVR